MYALAFLVGFCTSFGWWTAGKVQRSIDNSIANLPMVVQPKDKDEH